MTSFLARDARQSFDGQLPPRNFLNSAFFNSNFLFSQPPGALKISTKPHFLWVTEFPLFTKNDEDKLHLSKGRWSATHHPFTAPMHQDVEILDKVLEMKDAKSPSSSSDQGGLIDEMLSRIRGQHYDLVLDGVEIGGGSVRIHDGDMQENVFSRILEVSFSIR